MFKNNIYEMLNENTKGIVDEFMAKDMREVVYTSFDGDDMHDMLAICNQTIEKNKIPLNPEMALGYYISTETLGGNKMAVMSDCLTLTLFSDELWIYGRSDKLLSEGIMAEILLWNSMKKKGGVFIESPYKEEMLELNYIELKKWMLDISNEKFRNDLNNNLLERYKGTNNKTVYIGANFKNYKHIDWARVYAYKEKVCPISPQNILNYFIYYNLKKEKEQYLLDRLTLLSKADEYWLFIDISNFDKELKNLDQYTLAELYMLNTVYTNKMVKILDWGDIGVPKYNKTKRWALTIKEQEEILGSSWPIEYRE